MRAAIIGMGVVGRSQVRLLHAFDQVTYDVTDPDPYPADAIAGCDFAVICVGTPPGPGGRANLRYLHAALLRLPPALPVLIRSTVPPGTTDAIAATREGLVCHAPEFMQERSGAEWPNSADVPYLILGGAPESLKFFTSCLSSVFPARVWYCSALEAELAKYTANAYWATRVTFVNEMAGICSKFGVSWEQVRAAWLQDPRMSPAYTRMSGFDPGFGGACWPKDIEAIIAAAEDVGHKAHFLAAVADANVRFRSDA